ncbi:pollen receptor-like kinase 3 [Malania oleifera]|uniref:pollen receptor-like kinase 3 n=1 Tax=Malania oleifera TaxID=397392 RepID=UPI0025ADC26F|nr:pollen receptor-like kinase 3 [Malania oleifera]
MAAAAVLLLLLLLLPPLSLSLSTSEALLNLKQSFAPNDNLNLWTPDSSPCKGGWPGVVCDNFGIVTGIHLTGMNLSGKIDVDALYGLSSLRTISFVNNSFSGPIPGFNRLGALKSLLLSGNKFSGEIPADYFQTMTSLKKLWLSDNSFAGEIPPSVGKLPHLMELHLENNQFSGKIPQIGQKTITSLNLSNNRLEGEIPESLKKFNASLFQENDGLCGPPLNRECNPRGKLPLASPPSDKKGSKSKIVVVFIVAGALMIVIFGFWALLARKHNEEKFNILEKESLRREALEVRVAPPSGSTRRGGESNRRGGDSSRSRGSHQGKNNNSGVDLVIINEERGVFGLTDLMKAAAEVLGNGGLGSAYKAVMGNGVAVVVKRLREMNRLGREGFDAEIRRIGRLRHRNVLTPLAYHYRKEEKLLVSEYVPKGSLLYVLHGDRGICHAELNWPTRLKIVQGIARGMGFLHFEFASLDLPHGNLKSCNVLLNADYEPLLTDYAFHTLLNPAQASNALFAFRTPEAAHLRTTDDKQAPIVSPKSDVYCLGIIVLEIVSGKFPSQYLSTGNGGTDVVQWAHSAILEQRESEFIDPEIASAAGGESLDHMERLLRIGAACTESDPNKRVDMKEALRRIEEVRV